MSARLNGVFAQIINGWDGGKGEGKVTLVNGDHCCSLSPSDISNTEISQSLAEAISRDTEKRLFFVIVCDPTNPTNADVIAYERGHVFAAAKESLIS